MITRVSTITELKQIFGEILMNKTTKVTKISDESIVNGISYGVAKIAQKALKDIALVETHIFPDGAFGSHLDIVANKYGISDRFEASKSRTFVRVVGVVGTFYQAGVQAFTGGGVTFDLVEDVTIGANGYAYALVTSQTEGLATNVSALSIHSVNPSPLGHQYCVNEYQAEGGRDDEDDQLFRVRIKEGANLAARGTLAHLTQAFMKINTNVLRVYYHGVNALNQIVLAISTQNAAPLTLLELEEILQKGTQYLNISDLAPLGGTNINVEIKNIEYQPIDISLRVSLIGGADPDAVRKDLQVVFSKEIDYRFWEPNSKVEWDNLLQLAKNHPSISYVPDTWFYPNNDVIVDPTKLPRFRGFMLLDLEGNIISDVQGVLNPIYYPNLADFSFHQTILASL